MRTPSRNASADRGSATIWVAAFTGIICLSAMTTILIGGIRAARHQAQLAADMAALTAATRHTWGFPDACPQAGKAALKAGAHLTSCILTPSPTAPGTIADVTVTVTLPSFRHLAPFTIPATARAGPTAPSPPRSGPL